MGWRDDLKNSWIGRRADDAGQVVTNVTVGTVAKVAEITSNVTQEIKNKGVEGFAAAVIINPLGTAGQVVPQTTAVVDHEAALVAMNVRRDLGLPTHGIQSAGEAGKETPSQKEDPGLKNAMAKANSFNENGQKVAGYAETGLITGTAVVATVVTLPAGGVGGFVVMGASDMAIDASLNASTTSRGQAPPRTPYSVLMPADTYLPDWMPTVPVPFVGDVKLGGMHIGGDKRYQKGATPGDYFDEKWLPPTKTIDYAKNFAEEHSEEAAEIKRQAWAKFGLNPDGTPIAVGGSSSINSDAAPTATGDSGNNGAVTQSQDNNNDKPGFFSRVWTSIVDFFNSASNGIADLFKGPNQPPQTIVTHQVAINTDATMVIPGHGIPAQIQNTEKGI